MAFPSFAGLWLFVFSLPCFFGRPRLKKVYITLPKRSTGAVGDQVSLAFENEFFVFSHFRDFVMVFL